jgi:hypothetical protein
MANKYWFRFTYPPCPDDLNEYQKIKKYQILQHNTPNKSGYTKKVDKFSYYAKNTNNSISKITKCTGYNPPGASDVPGKTWDLNVTESIINTSSILNNTRNIQQSGPSTWSYTSEQINTN